MYSHIKVINNHQTGRSASRLVWLNCWPPRTVEDRKCCSWGCGSIVPIKIYSLVSTRQTKVPLIQKAMFPETATWFVLATGGAAHPTLPEPLATWAGNGKGGASVATIGHVDRKRKCWRFCCNHWPRGPETEMVALLL